MRYVMNFSFLSQLLNPVRSISLPLSIFSPVWFFFPPSLRERERERSCIVGVCCPSARAKIDSKLQSLLRTPHCAAWPQNNTHRHTLADSHTNMKYTVCCPTSIFPVQPVDVTITQKLSQCANRQSCTKVMCQWRKLWVWFTDVNAITASSQLTKTHTHTHSKKYLYRYVFIPLPWSNLRKQCLTLQQTHCCFLATYYRLFSKKKVWPDVHSQCMSVRKCELRIDLTCSGIPKTPKIKHPEENARQHCELRQGSDEWTSQVFVILTFSESKQAMTLPFSTWQLLAGWANLHSLSGREHVPLWNSRQTSSVSHFVSRIDVTFTAILNQAGGVD